MLYDNEVTIIIDSKSQNESLARVSAMSFVSQLDPKLSDIEDIKTAVSEAVTNAIIHGYNNNDKKKVYLNFKYKEDEVYIEVKDEGIGISNIEEARKPLYTSKPEIERSGMGFTVMETFMDNIEVISTKDKGTTIKMMKKIDRS